MFFVRYRSDVDRGQMSKREAVERVVHDLTGIQLRSRNARPASSGEHEYVTAFDPMTRERVQFQN